MQTIKKNWLTFVLLACTQLAFVNAYCQRQSLLTYKDEGGVIRDVQRPEEWNIRREQILGGMQDAMGQLPQRSQLPPLDVQFKDTLTEKVYTRFTIDFTVAEGEILPAYLYLPVSTPRKEKLPAMLVLHGTGDGGKELVDGNSPKANRALAKELAARGYVVIAPDYPSMGELRDYDFTKDRYESGTMKAIFNHMRCVDFLQTLPVVDPQRVGVIGHSLGGHNAMFVGAFDQRLKVIVASCGWTLMDYYDIGEEGSKRYGGRLGPWAQDRYMPLLRTKYNLDGEQFPFDFDEVIAALAPRPFFSNSPVNDTNFDVEGVRKGIASARKVYEFFKAGENLQVYYPDAGHDFPEEVRLKAYQYIDKVLKHKPREHLMK
jgi:pimeloyl-ACP methyl ester carboxylesterase